MSTARAHLLISGRVQGVNFRYYTYHEAKKHGLSGWVRNLWDGRVEVVFEGDDQVVRQMVDWCHHGPPSSRVDAVDVQWEEPEGLLHGFDIRGTASV